MKNGIKRILFLIINATLVAIRANAIENRFVNSAGKNEA